MMICAHMTEWARYFARIQKGGKEPSSKETNAALQELCENVLLQINEILMDENGEFPSVIDKVDAIGYIFEKYTVPSDVS